MCAHTEGIRLQSHARHEYVDRDRTKDQTGNTEVLCELLAGHPVLEEEYVRSRPKGRVVGGSARLRRSHGTSVGQHVQDMQDMR